MWIAPLLLVFAYLLGSIPSGLLLAHAFRLKDPREVGSGNIGASNLTRLGGKKLGFLTLVSDVAKGILPLYACQYFFPDGLNLQAAAGFLAVLGHCFPIYLKFKGGKGVATSAGVFVFLAPWPSLVGFGIWILVFLWKKITSLASLAATATVLLALLALRAPEAIIFAAGGINLLIFYRHKENIRALKAGTERSFR